MNDKEYIASPRRLKELLSRHDFIIKKNFGQNFLIDTNVLRKIVLKAGIDDTTICLEIGPGVGSLTQMLATYAKRVECFEIDTKLVPLLEETVGDYRNVSVHFTDFLQLDLDTWYETLTLQADEQLKVVANLPYYITTAILEKLISWYVRKQPKLVSATVMMQKEVAARLVAKPGTKEYGSLSIFLQLFSDVKTVFDVSAKVFIPEPRIDSSIVNITFKRPKYFTSYEAAEKFLAFVRLCFATRRKTLYNNLKGTFSTDDITAALHDAQLRSNVRAEQLSIEDFLALFKLLAGKGIQHE